MGGNFTKEELFEDPLFEAKIPFKKTISKEYRFKGSEFKKRREYSIIKSNHLPTNTDLVIKKIRKDDKNLLVEKLFLREVIILKSLDHPQIVKIFEYFENQNFFYIINLFLKGDSVLNFFIKKKKNVTNEKIYEIIFQILKIFHLLEQNLINLRNLDIENFIYNGKTVSLIGLSKAIKVKNEFQSVKNSYGPIAFKSPEMFKNNYGFKSYSWFVGIYLHFILTGKLPFKVLKNEKKQIKEINSFKFKKEYLEKKKIHADFITIIEMCLRKSPGLRPSVADLLSTPIFKQKLAGKKIIKSKGNNYIKKLSSYKQQNEFIKNFNQFFAEKLVQPEEKVELRKMFDEFDSDKNGHLSLEELKNGLSFTNINMTNEEIEDLFVKCDLDHNGSLEFNEFYTALMDFGKKGQKEKLKQFFNFCDYNQNSSLSIEELNTILNIDITKNKVTYKYFKKVARKDGVLNFEEFTLFFDHLLNDKKFKA